MDEKKREDAADRAPRPDKPTHNTPADQSGTQDAPNYAETTDGGRALKPEDVSSANDE